MESIQVPPKGDMKQFCRVCMDTSVTLIDIFSKQQAKDRDPSLPDMMNNILKENYQVKRDALPQHICSCCVLAAENAYHFKQRCEQSFSYFCQLLKEADNCDSMEKYLRELNTENPSFEADFDEEFDKEMKERGYQFVEVMLDEKKLEGEPLSLEYISDSEAEIDGLQEEPESLPCNECGMILKSEYSLSQHMGRVHKTEVDHSHLCETCGKDFKSKAQLITHNRSHTGERPFKCMHCDKTYSQPTALRMHLVTHGKERPFKCQQCDKTFFLHRNLKAHQRRHNGLRPFQCPSCPLAFTKSANLKTHLRQHTGERPFKCSKCDMSFRQNQHLITHLRVHNDDRPFKCLECDKSFFVNANLKKHMRIHTGEKPFKCETCGQAFSHNHHLKSHIRIHTGERPYKCTECEKLFASNQSLQKHLNWHQNNKDKPYKCPHCPKGFDQFRNLKYHLRTHKVPIDDVVPEPKDLEGEKSPHKCPYCDVSFELKIILEKHLTTHKERPDRNNLKNVPKDSAIIRH